MKVGDIHIPQAPLEELVRWTASKHSPQLVELLAGFWTLYSPLLVVTSLLPSQIQIFFLYGAFLLAKSEAGAGFKEKVQKVMPTELVAWILSRLPISKAAQKASGDQETTEQEKPITEQEKSSTEPEQL